MTRVWPTLAAAAAGLVLAGCTFPFADGFASGVFKCATDYDCINGYECYRGRCLLRGGDGVAYQGGDETGGDTYVADPCNDAEVGTPSSCDSGQLCCGTPAGCAQCPGGAAVAVCTASGGCAASSCVDGFGLCEGTCMGWTVQPIVLDHQVACETEIGMDTNGRIFVGYYSPDDLTVKVVATDADGWAAPVVVEAAGSWSCPEFNALGMAIHPTTLKPCVAYYDATTGAERLRYACDVGGGYWTRETVANAYARFVELAIDGTGTPHIVYQDNDGSHIYYATKSGTWTTRQIGTGTSTEGRGLAITTDATNAPHIVYMANTAEQVRYTTPGSPFWVDELVEVSGEWSGWVDIAIDPSGRPAVVYVMPAVNEMHYAVRDGASWDIETADQDPGSDDVEVGHDPTLAYDEGGRAVVAEYGAGWGSYDGLRFAQRSANGVWCSHFVQASYGAGQYASMALDAAGHPNIAFTAGFDGALFLARSDWN